MIRINSQQINSRTGLCVGLDLHGDNILQTAKKIIEHTNEFVSAYKANIQFWHGTTKSDYLDLTEFVHGYDIPIIADLKISDIGSSNRAGIENMAEFGFDYVTISPFPGNLAESHDFARNADIGLITLVLMSNPQAKWMITSDLYKTWAAESNIYSDGIVLGTTGHVTPSIINEVATLCTKPFVLAPGIGTQGGSAKVIQSAFPNRVIFNVGRGISQSEDSRAAAIKYLTLIRSS